MDVVVVLRPALRTEKQIMADPVADDLNAPRSGAGRLEVTLRLAALRQQAAALLGESDRLAQEVQAMRQEEHQHRVFVTDVAFPEATRAIQEEQFAGGSAADSAAEAAVNDDATISAMLRRGDADTSLLAAPSAAIEGGATRAALLQQARDAQAAHTTAVLAPLMDRLRDMSHGYAAQSAAILSPSTAARCAVGL
jgi:hypothetical protein